MDALVYLALRLRNIIQPHDASRPCDEHAHYSKQGDLGSAGLAEVDEELAILTVS